MKRLLGILAAGILLSFTPPAQAQQVNNYWCSVSTVPCPPSAWLPTSAANPFPITGALSIAGATSNASSGVATSSTNLPTVSYNYGFNGTTWDQLQVDGSKNLKVLESNSAAILTALGSPFQAGGSIGNTSFGISGTLPAGTNLLGKVGIDQTTPGTTNNVSVGNSPTVLGTGFYSKASITRSANTTTYTANTGWNNGTPTFFSFTSACRGNGTQVLIPRIDIWSSANPTLKLTGVLYLFSAVPGTNVSDDATFTIAAADFANLTANFGGIPFTLGNNQASGAANSGVSLVGTTYQAQCASGTTTITGMVEVTNAYVPASAEVLNVGIATVGVN